MDTSKTPKQLHYAWVICLCGLWLFLCNQGLCSNMVSVYLPFIEATGISHSLGSTILSIRCLFSFAVTFLVEVYYRKLSLRTGVFLACLIGVLSSVVYAVGGSAPVYYVGAALAGIAYGLGCMYPVSLLLTNWFHTSKGLALGISTAGSGIPAMLFSHLISDLVLRYSLRVTFLFQALFMLISAVCIFLLLRDEPAQKGLTPYMKDGEGGEKDRPSSSAQRQEGPKTLPPVVLGMLATIMLLIGGAGQAYIGHLSVLVRSCGYSVQTAATVVSLQGMLLTCSKLLSGGMADRFGSKWCSALLMALFLLGCALTRFLNGVSLFWCFLPVVLMAYGASFYNVGPPLWAADLSDRAGYPKLFKWMQLFYNLGGILISAVPGFIADHTGEYKSSYILIAAMTLVSLVLLLRSYRLGLKKA